MPIKKSNISPHSSSNSFQLLPKKLPTKNKTLRTLNNVALPPTILVVNPKTLTLDDPPIQTDPTLHQNATPTRTTKPGAHSTLVTIANQHNLIVLTRPTTTATTAATTLLTFNNSDLQITNKIFNLQGDRKLPTSLKEDAPLQIARKILPKKKQILQKIKYLYSFSTSYY